MAFLKALRPQRSTRRARPGHRLAPKLERLEERTLLAIEPLTVADPRFWGDSGDAPAILGDIQGLSADGRWLVFQSEASNLVPDDANATTDVFLYDRGNGRVKLVSGNAVGTGAGRGPSMSPVISPDGRRIAFVSEAEDLVAGVAGRQLYLYDVATGLTSLASQSTEGIAADSNNLLVESAIFSRGGDHLLFVSDATNLDPTVTGNHADVLQNLFWRDLAGGITRMVTVDASGTMGAGLYGTGHSYSLSSDGRHVAFLGQSDEFIGGDSNGLQDVFVRDMQEGVTRLITAAADGGSADGVSRIGPNSISDDGRFVLFTSLATNLVPGTSDFNVFLRDVTATTTTLVSVDAAGEPAGGAGVPPALTPDGKFAAFVTGASGVVLIDDEPVGGINVYRRNLTSMATEPVSVNAGARAGGNGPSGDGSSPVMTPDGRFVAFTSEASDLVGDVADANQNLTGAMRRDVFVRDMHTGVTRVASQRGGGRSTGSGPSFAPFLSSDGNVVAFQSDATDLVGADANEASDLFLRDLAGSLTELASLRSSLVPERVLAGGTQLASSRDGRFLLFLSRNGTRLTPDVPGIRQSAGDNLFRLDRMTGQIDLVSVRPDGSAAATGATGIYSAASISDDGRFVAFSGFLNDLDERVAAESGGVYVRDMHLGITRLASRNAATGEPANENASFAPNTVISPDGRFVAFGLDATNLISGVTFGVGANLFVYDRVADSLHLLTGNSAGGTDGDAVDDWDFKAIVSADSRRIVFISASSDLVTGVTDVNPFADVFYADLAGPEAFQTKLVSESVTPGQTPNSAWSIAGPRGVLAVSGDGRYVAFPAQADDLAAAGTLANIQVYVRDIQTSSTVFASVTSTGMEGNGVSWAPALNRDGRKVLFQSSADDLTTFDSKGVSQLYVRDLDSNTTQLISFSADGAAGGSGASGSDTLRPIARFSDDGRYAAFLSDAPDLVAGFIDRNGGPDSPDLYLRDIDTGQTVVVTWNSSGTAGNDASPSAFALATNGTVVFTSNASDLVNGDRAGAAQLQFADVFAYSARGGASIAGNVQDDSGAALRFWTVYHDENRNARFDTGEENVVTDLGGNYRFNGLAAGNYPIGFVLDDGYVAVGPAVRSVSLASAAHAVTQVDFVARRSAVDLSIASTFSAATLAPGESLTTSWTVRNLGVDAATGWWQDAVYLSRDGLIDASDVLLATVPRAGGLAAGRSYAASATVVLPATLQGEYRLIVQTDRNRQVIADADRSNNLVSSDAPLTVEIPRLTLDQTQAAQFTAASRSRYFAVTVPVGQPLVVTLGEAAAELYIRRHDLPSPGVFDFANLRAGPGDQVTVPSAAAGTYFIRVRYTGSIAPSQAVGFTIHATTAVLHIDAIEQTRGGNNGHVTVPVRGTAFTPQTVVKLALGAAEIVAERIEFRDASLLYATFDLTGQAGGIYDVVAADGLNRDVLPAAFTVTTLGRVGLHVRLNTPWGLRAFRFSPISVTYENIGDVDLPAPLLFVSAADAEFRFADRSDVRSNSIEIIGIAPDGPAGVLRPGQVGSVEVNVRNLVDVDFLEISLAQVDDAAPIDWGGIKDSLRPDHIAPDAWDAVFANLVADAGTSGGDYRRMLADAVTYLGSIGAATPDAAAVNVFALDRAGGVFAGGSPLEFLDADFPAPGVPLHFVRTHGQAIHQRYFDGPLGRGWTHNWDVSATTDADGNVTIRNGFALRYFARNPDGSFRSAPGDRGVLALAGGIYTLTEPSETTTVFLPGGRLDYVQVTNGNRVTAGYDGAGRLTSVTHSSGAALTLHYDASGHIDLVTDPAGRTVSYEYAGSHLVANVDKFGRHEYEYAVGLGAAREHALTAIREPDGTRREFSYDPRGRLILDNQVGGSALSYEYPPAGGLRLRDALGNATTILADRFGQVRRTIDPTGAVYNFGYDAHRNLTTAVLPQGVTYQFEYDANDQLTRLVDPFGRSTTFEFCGCGSIVSYTDTRGHSTRYTYDAARNLTAVTRAGGLTDTFTYDARGNTDVTINRRGNAIDYNFDANGQVTRKHFADGTQIDYVYDARGRLTRVTQAAEIITLEYWPTDLLKKITYTDGKFLEFTYDAAGRRTQIVDQDSFSVSYQYDSAGRLLEVTDAAGRRVILYTYDAAGRLSREDRANLTATTYDYDAPGRVKSITHLKPDGVTVNSSFAYDYDLLGRLVKTTTEMGVTNYAYDALGQLTDVALPDGRTIRYEYDAAGNRTRVVDSVLGTTDYTVDALNQYVSAGDTTFTYDADGNLRSRTNTAGTTTYTFDDEDRLIGVAGPGLTASYHYDALGQRAGETVNGQSTSYLVDPAGLWGAFAEYSGSGALLAHYTQGLGLASRTDGLGNSVFYDFDLVGNTTGLTGGSGDYVNRYSYLPFGDTAVLSAGVANPFTFGGQFGVRSDADSTFDMRFRRYDAATGAFLSDDPLGLGGGDTNLRRYVTNRPTTRMDPMGLAPCELAIAVTGETIGALKARGVEPGELFIGILFGGLDLVCDEDYDKETDDKKTEDIEEIKKELGERERRRAEELLKQFRKDYEQHRPPLPSLPFPDLSKVPATKKRVKPVKSDDPNDIIGPMGFGDDHFVASDTTLAYMIRFENQPAASAAAQEVFVTHTLDANLDPATFRLGDLGFGSVVVDVPDGRQSFSTRVHYSNVAQGNTPLLVDIHAEFDAAAGKITWTFRSVDPKTGLLPDGILEGLLPPNDATHRGEGFVRFSAQQRTDRPTGSVVDQQASIVFDTNAAIETNVFTNTIDAGGPTSSVQALPPTTATARFTVSWSGSDDASGSPGSGIASFDIFVSDNGGPFVLWQDDTTRTSAEFTGEPGHTYGFYSVATDHVGHVQPKPAGAQSSTQIEPPDTTAPQVNSLQLVRDARGKKITQLVINFGERLDQVAAENAANYVLTVRKGRKSRPVAIHSITYAAQADSSTVTLVPSLALSAKKRYEILVRSSGILDLAGNLLDGDANGLAGGDFVRRLRG